jgi:hypothetical protein
MSGGQCLFLVFISIFPCNQVISWGFLWVDSTLYYVLDFLIWKEFDCVICNGSFSALMISVPKASFCDSSFGFNAFLSVLQKCSLFLYDFGFRSGPLFRLVGCVVSVFLIF